jgi:DNA-binding HxlR family transcriptional regulator
MVEPAELFEAISHPERIKILKILSKQPSSFAALKRQLGIESSGNLDYHLKKLGLLVTVRKEDGLYGLTDAGKEALLSVEAIEMWTEMERHKLKVPGKMPKAAFFLGVLEFCTTGLILLYLYFLVMLQMPPSSSNLFGYPTFFVILLLAGLCSGAGIFMRKRWSWTTMLTKSAIIILMSLCLLGHVLNPANFSGQLNFAEISYLLFVAAEIAVVFVALRHPIRDYLGVGNEIRPSFAVIFGGLLCVFSGILLILLRGTQNLTQLPSSASVFTSITDVSILCGLAIAVGGVLILLRVYNLGSLVSVIFGLFPPSIIYGHPSYDAYHLFDIINSTNIPGHFWIAIIADALPIIGAAVVLLSVRKTRG